MLPDGTLRAQADWEPDTASWRLQAACRGADPNLFFPEKGKPTFLAAVEYCDRCPVAAECLDYAMGYRFLQGIFGGTTEQDRRRMRRQRRTA